MNLSYVPLLFLPISRLSANCAADKTTLLLMGVPFLVGATFVVVVVVVIAAACEAVSVVTPLLGAVSVAAKRRRHRVFFSKPSLSLDLILLDACRMSLGSAGS